jgi:hypothetical protein
MEDTDPREPLLADLINDRKGTRSFEDMAKDTGGAVTRGRFQQLATVRQQSQFPTPATLRGVVAATNLPMREVVLAAARSVGLQVPPDDPTVLAIAGAGSLPADQKELLLNLARDLIRANQAGRRARGGDPAEEDPPEAPRLAVTGISAEGNDPATAVASLELTAGDAVISSSAPPPIYN